MEIKRDRYLNKLISKRNNGLIKVMGLLDFLLNENSLDS